MTPKLKMLLKTIGSKWLFRWITAFVSCFMQVRREPNNLHKRSVWNCFISGNN